MAGLDCCCRILKYLVFLVNFLTTLAGLAVVALASVGLAYINKGLLSTEADTKNFLWICIVLLVLGLVMTIIGFVGCCGACRESQCCLGTYVTFMLIGLGLTVAGGVLLHQKRDILVKEAIAGVRKVFENVRRNPDTADLLQQSLHCCGAQDYKTWEDPTGLAFPQSCCRSQSGGFCQSPQTLNVIPDKSTTERLYYPGCIKVAEDILESVVTYAPILLGFVGLIQVLAFIFSLALCCAIRNNTYKAGYRV